MVRNIFFAIALFAATAMQAQNVIPDKGEKPFVIPEVTSWTSQGEDKLMLSGRIIVQSKTLLPAAEALVADHKALYSNMGSQPVNRKWTVEYGKRKPHKGDVIFISRKHDTMGEEGYQLSMGNVKGYCVPVVEVSAPTSTGAFWATRTLLQLMQPEGLPYGTITDVPQYRLRGFVFDVGRKYVPMDYLRQLVQLMGYYKMNTLQLHLNDNGFKKYFDEDWLKTQAAFRLQCDTYPGLTAIDGSYTKQEFIELQQLAEKHGVEIIPEIDSPAHSLAFTHYRPDLASKEYGMDHFDLSNPDVYSFMDALFKEYLSGDEPVFRGPRVNIGTDEYSNAKQNVVEQFRAYTDHYLALVESYGKQPMLWGALTHAQGETPVRHEGVLMNCWYNGYAQPDSMKQLGYQLVSVPDGMVYIVPKAGYYNDYLNCQYLYENWTPAVIGDKRFKEQDKQIEGGMFALWNDIPDSTITTEDLHDRIFPAMQTIAVKTWTGQKTQLPYANFDALRKKQTLPVWK